MPGRTPRDLALFVYGRLGDDDSRPSVEVLDELFQTLFLTSLKTEEGTPITVAVAYVDPKNPDPKPPPRLRDHRWRYAALAYPVEYNVSQLTKIALAMEPSSSSLAVFPDRKGGLKIWGLFDQQGGFQSLLSHEKDGGFAPPGIIQVQIIGVGHIIVTDDLRVLAELNGGNLVEDSIDVFKGSIIAKKLTSGYERRIAQITKSVKKEGCSFESECVPDLMEDWVKTLRRVLLRARAFSHGGAFLLTDSDVTNRLTIKHKLCYERIPTLFENWMRGKIIDEEHLKFLLQLIQDMPDQMDPAKFLANDFARSLTADAEEGMAGAVSFVASLSRVDGLVLMDTDLVVHGFGCEIIAAGDPDCPVFHANYANPTKGKLKRLDLQRFGTRHRTMARYCSEDESAVGFVVSNDGPVRAFSRAGKRLYCWDNVQLGRSLTSHDK